MYQASRYLLVRTVPLPNGNNLPSLKNVIDSIQQMVLNMKHEFYRIAAHELASQTGTPNNKSLTTRYFGRSFCALLLERMRALPENTVIELAFGEIEVMDASFPDEVLGGLLARRLDAKEVLPPVFLSELSESNQESIEFTLLSRPERQKGLRNCVIPVRPSTNYGLVLVGKCEDGFRQTFDLLRALKRLTTRQVMDALRLSPQAASSRLKTLYDNGVALRQEAGDGQGKQFVYDWLL